MILRLMFIEYVLTEVLKNCRTHEIDRILDKSDLSGHFLLQQRIAAL